MNRVAEDYLRKRGESTTAETQLERDQAKFSADTILAVMPDRDFREAIRREYEK